jgi:hypothetical protein
MASEAAKRDGDRRVVASRPPQGRSVAAPRGRSCPTSHPQTCGAARNELKTLKENAEQVARHLAMAARLIDDDPSSHTRTPSPPRAAPAASRSCARPSRSPPTRRRLRSRCANCALGASPAVTTRSRSSSTASAGSAGPTAPSKWDARRSRDAACRSARRAGDRHVRRRLDLGETSARCRNWTSPSSTRSRLLVESGTVRRSRRRARGARPLDEAAAVAATRRGRRGRAGCRGCRPRGGDRRDRELDIELDDASFRWTEGTTTDGAVLAAPRRLDRSTVSMRCSPTSMGSSTPVRRPAVCRRQLECAACRGARYITNNASRDAVVANTCANWGWPPHAPKTS